MHHNTRIQEAHLTHNRYDKRAQDDNNPRKGIYIYIYIYDSGARETHCRMETYIYILSYSHFSDVFLSSPHKYPVVKRRCVEMQNALNAGSRHTMYDWDNSGVRALSRARLRPNHPRFLGRHTHTTLWVTPKCVLGDAHRPQVGPSRISRIPIPLRRARLLRRLWLYGIAVRDTHTHTHVVGYI